MSKRHRASATVERAPKRDRRWRTHQERQAVRASLTAAPDPEEVLDPQVVHHGPRSTEAAAPPRRRRRRHWKLKDWKRRTAQRRERALAHLRLSEEV